MIIKLFEYLKDNGADVYFVGQHKGECKSPYIVLKDDGTSSLNGKTGTSLIDVLFFIPQNNFTKCEPNTETGIVVDDEKKALTFSVMYEFYKKL